MIERTVKKKLLTLSKDFKVILTEGARQVGKTTLLQAASKDESSPARTYVSLDTRNSLNLAQNDPDGFFELNPLPIFIDEVQRAPGLFLKVKEIVDASDEKGLVWMTGSQKPFLKRGVDETLVGRVADLTMYPLSQAEKQGDPYRPSFYPSLDAAMGPAAEAKWNYTETVENIILGGYPALLSLAPENRSDFFRSYINHYLLGDIRYEGLEMNERTFRKLLRVLAARTATSLNISAVARDVEITVYKAENLISLLESFGIITLIEPFSTNSLKKVVKTPRLHFTDSGLCCHLLGIQTPAQFLAHHLAGFIFESYAVSEIIRNARNNGDYADFYFYREETKGSSAGPAEIDLIKDSGGKLYPFEIKLNASPRPAMASAFSRLPSELCGLGTIICTSSKTERLSPSLIAVPVSNI